MSSPFRSVLALVLLCSATALAERDRATASADPPPLAQPPGELRRGEAHPGLRVCADPNNLPFSNNREEGFENRLAAIVARDLHRTVEYTWWAERRGYVRNTVSAGICDVWMGVPFRSERLLTTRPYYRSAYVFVTRKAGPIRAASLDDPVLRRARVGVQLIGDDGWNSPPAHALAERHIVSNVVGFTVYGNYLEPNPPARIVDAVADGDVDIAVVWGPLAGYFAARSAVPLRIAPIGAQVDRRTSLPLAFDISVGVSKRASRLRDEIDQALARRRVEVRALLDRYGVPRVAR